MRARRISSHCSSGSIVDSFIVSPFYRLLEGMSRVRKRQGTAATLAPREVRRAMDRMEKIQEIGRNDATPGVGVMQSALAHTVFVPTGKEILSSATGGSQYPIHTGRGPIGRAVNAAVLLGSGPPHAPRYGLSSQNARDNSLQGSRLPPVARQNNSYNLRTVGVDLNSGDYPIISKRPLTIGLSEQARISAGNTTMSIITGANRALASGQFATATYILGRQLTEEEIANGLVGGLTKTLQNANLPGQIEEKEMPDPSQAFVLRKDSMEAESKIEEATQKGWLIEDLGTVGVNGQSDVRITPTKKQLVPVEGSQGRQGFASGIAQTVKVGPFGVPTIETARDKLTQLGQIIGNAKNDVTVDSIQYIGSKTDRPANPATDEQTNSWFKATPEGNPRPDISSNSDTQSKLAEIVTNSPKSIELFCTMMAPVLKMAPGLANDPKSTDWMQSSMNDLLTNTSGAELEGIQPIDRETSSFLVHVLTHFSEPWMQEFGRELGASEEVARFRSLPLVSSSTQSISNTFGSNGFGYLWSALLGVVGANAAPVRRQRNAYLALLPAFLEFGLSVLSYYVQQPAKVAAQDFLMLIDYFSPQDPYTQSALQLAQMVARNGTLGDKAIPLSVLQEYLVRAKPMADAAAARLENAKQTNSRALVPFGSNYTGIDYHKDQMIVEEYLAVNSAVQKGLEMSVSSIKVDMGNTGANRSAGEGRSLNGSGEVYNGDDYNITSNGTNSGENVQRDDEPMTQALDDSSAESKMGTPIGGEDYEPNDIYGAAKKDIYNNYNALRHSIREGTTSLSKLGRDIYYSDAGIALHNLGPNAGYATPYIKEANEYRKEQRARWANDNVTTGEGLELHTDIGNEKHYRVGKLAIDKPMLHQNIVRIRHAKHGGKIDVLKEVEVSKPFKHRLTEMILTGKMPSQGNLSDNEYAYMRRIVKHSGAEKKVPHKEMLRQYTYKDTRGLGMGKGLHGTPIDLKTQLKMAQGIQRAGNNSPALAKHIHDLLQQMGANHTSIGSRDGKKFRKVF